MSEGPVAYVNKSLVQPSLHRLLIKIMRAGQLAYADMPQAAAVLSFPDNATQRIDIVGILLQLLSQTDLGFCRDCDCACICWAL